MMDGRIEARLYSTEEGKYPECIQRTSGEPLISLNDWEDFCVQVFKVLEGHFPVSSVVLEGLRSRSQLVPGYGDHGGVDSDVDVEAGTRGEHQPPLPF
jgi:hypothetical protein